MLAKDARLQAESKLAVISAELYSLINKARQDGHANISYNPATLPQTLVNQLEDAGYCLSYDYGYISWERTLLEKISDASSNGNFSLTVVLSGTVQYQLLELSDLGYKAQHLPEKNAIKINW